MSRADLAFEDVEDRCSTCFKRLQVDLGAGFHGEVTAVYLCPNCGPIPQARDWESSIRDAVRVVLARRCA